MTPTADCHPLLRTWLFGPGADSVVHETMSASGADVLIQDLEDFTPPSRRNEARALAADLMAERSREAVEIDHARRRFVLECRAAHIEPIDAPYTFTDAKGAAQEARYARRLGYRAKCLVRPDHTAAIFSALVPSDAEK